MRIGYAKILSVDLGDIYNSSKIFQDRYAEFRPYVEELRVEIKRYEKNPKKHPRHLNSGRTVNVYLLEIGEKEYAVRFLNRLNDKQHLINRLAGFLRGLNISSMEQLIAVSMEEDITISQLMPGQKVSELSAEAVACISEPQIAKLIDILIEAYDKNIVIDTNPGNFFYDRRAGFGIIDYYFLPGFTYSFKYINAEILEQFKFNFERHISKMLNAGNTPPRGTLHEELKTFYLNKIRIIETYKQITKQKLPEEAYLEILEVSQKMLKQIHRAANRYGIIL